MDVMTLAARLARLIDEKGLEVTAEDLSQFEGVGDAKATLVLAPCIPGRFLPTPYPIEPPQ